MRALPVLMLVVLAAGAAPPADAQIWRWVDDKGTTHFSSAPPPAGAKARLVDPGTPSPAAPEAAEPKDCQTVRCQGERLEARLERREALEAKQQAERAAAAPKPVRGLEFRKYISLQRGMSEGEALGIAGEPDLVTDQGIAIAAPSTVQVAPGVRGPARAGLAMKTWTWMPTPADPFTTTVTLVGGRISELERVRKF